MPSSGVVFIVLMQCLLTVERLTDVVFSFVSGNFIAPSCDIQECQSRCKLVSCLLLMIKSKEHKIHLK